ncbi:MAG TPA: glycosyltransferase [Nanoarchaeota archaeon]|nr:glycosyltransferase [Nanoarchaeota archaeon]
MNIAVFNEFFSPYITGGTEIFLKEFCRYLERKGHKITVITSYLVKGETGFTTYKIKSSPICISHMQQLPGITTPFLLFNHKLEKRIKEILEKEKIEIAYINNIYHLSFSTIRACLRKNLPLILDVHDYWPVCFSKDKYYLGKKFCKTQDTLKCSFCLFTKYKFPVFLFFPFLKIEKEWRKKFLEKLKTIIVHSKFVKKVLQSTEEFKNKEINVIPYPLLVSFSKRIKKPKIEKELRLLFVGRVEFNKGADLLLKIAKKLKNKKINFRIDVIGRGKLMKKLDKKELNIHVHGFLGKERFKYFEKAHILLAPSRWPEPFGIVALEAAAYKTPVITLEFSGGLAEVVKENKIGLLAKENNLEEKITLLTSNSWLYKEIQKNCEKILPKYSTKRIFRKYMKLFKI